MGHVFVLLVSLFTCFLTSSICFQRRVSISSLLSDCDLAVCLLLSYKPGSKRIYLTFLVENCLKRCLYLLINKDLWYMNQNNFGFALQTVGAPYLRLSCLWALLWRAAYWTGKHQFRNELGQQSTKVNGQEMWSCAVWFDCQSINSSSVPMDACDSWVRFEIYYSHIQIEHFNCCWGAIVPLSISDCKLPQSTNGWKTNPEKKH